MFSSRRRHTRSKRDWSSDVCSSDLNEAGLVVDGPVDEAARGQGQVPEVESGRTAEFVVDLGELGHGLVEPGHGQGLCARSQVMVPAADGETGVEDAADLRLAAFGAELLVVVLVGGPRMHGEFDDEGVALDLDSGEAAVMIGELAGLPVVRQSPQTRAL